MAPEWWLACALVAGGVAAILAYALMNMAREEEDRALEEERTVSLLQRADATFTRSE